MIKAILFDIDGTLLDSDEALYRLFRDALKILGKRPKSKDEILKYSGLTAQEWLFKLAGKIDKEKLKQAHGYLVQDFTDRIKKARPMKHAEHVLKELKKRGIKTAIITNQEHEEIVQSMHQLHEHVSLISYAGKKHKPNPFAINQALKKFNVKKREAIYVGDSQTDVLTGKNAKVKTLILTHQRNKKLKAEKINDLLEVLKFL